MLASKGWSYFWITWCVLFAVLDVLTGSIMIGILMALLGVYFAWDLRQKNKGTHALYNKYFGEKV